MKIISIITLSIVLFLSCSNQAENKNNQSDNISPKKNVPQVVVVSWDTVFSFNNCVINKIPVGWSQYYTGKAGETPNWKVVDDNGNKVLAQLSEDNPNYHFNEIIFDGFEVKNMELNVKIKGVEGKMDQGGGFVWRFIDANNYYVVRANPLEDNVVLYKVEDGKRTDLPVLGKGRTYGVDVKALGSGWNSLKLKVLNNTFTVYLNNKEIFQVEDSTFPNAGKVGLWTKADAITYFDNFYVIALDE